MKDTLLIGGHSKLGLAIRSHNQFSGKYVCRNEDNGELALQVRDYFQISSSDIEGYRYVYNLAGTSIGNARQLEKVNVDLTLHLARESKKAGAEKFFYISSFSVFGHADNIGRETLLRPVSSYGKSKLLAEKGLQKLSNSTFSVIIVRLPMLYGSGDAKLEKLLKIWMWTRVFPIPHYGSKRSMLHYDMAADALLRLPFGDWCGAIALADPKPFCFQSAAQIMSDTAKRKILALYLGNAMLAPMRFFLPNLYQSLYTSSYLQDSFNTAIGLELDSRIEGDLAAIALGQCYGR